MKKNLRLVALSFGVVLILFVVAMLLFPGLMVKSTVNTVGPGLLGVEVKLDDASFRLLKGEMKLDGLFIGNPKGFNTESLCKVGVISVDLDPASLRTDTILINRIYVEKPVFTYQKSVLESNLSKLLKGLEGDEKDPEKEDTAEAEGGKKVIISKMIIKDPMVKLSIKGIPAGAPIPLPDIEMSNIGKDSGGTSPVEVLKTVFGAVLSAVKKVALAPVKVISKTGSVATDAVKGVGKGIIGAAKSLTGTDKED